MLGKIGIVGLLCNLSVLISDRNAMGLGALHSFCFLPRGCPGIVLGQAEYVCSGVPLFKVVSALEWVFRVVKGMEVLPFKVKFPALSR